MLLCEMTLIWGSSESPSRDGSKGVKGCIEAPSQFLTHIAR